MPDRLDLDERLDPIKPLGFGPGPENLARCSMAADALEIVGRELGQLLAELAVGRPYIEGVDVHVRGKRGCDLCSVTGEQVDDARGNVCRRNRFGEGDGSER